MGKLRTIMRHLFFILLSIVIHQGFAEPQALAHLDKSILQHYQNAHTTTAFLPQQSIDKKIDKLYEHIQKKEDTTTARLYYFSEYYLNYPYILFPLGEGHPSKYDEMPRIRLDGFDCQTYVDTILALTLADNTKHFKQCLDKVRYRDGIVSFVTRNHFTSLDWNKNNQLNGYLEDITPSIRDEKKQVVAQYASTEIDKASWYKKLPQARIRIPTLTTEQQAIRLAALHAEGKHFQPQNTVVPYIPLNQLITQQGQLNSTISSQIPSGAIIEIVRPNWPLKAIIGTNLDISHIGFAFWKSDILYFRQASSSAHKVIDIPLLDYLNEAAKNPTIGGINIQMIKGKTPRSNC